jgi:small subunit ribosomal protein S6
MWKYELTIILPGSATAAKKKSVSEKLKKLITASKGKIGKMEDWGKKELSYKIAKNDSGIFLHFPLELEAEVAKNLDTKLNLEEDIIRYLLIRV